jgi:hypothetical protein
VAPPGLPSPARLPALPALAGLRLGAPVPRLPLTLPRLPLILPRPPLALPRPPVGLPPVELGAELVAAALPALGDLLDGVAHRLEPVQLPRPGAP